MSRGHFLRTLADLKTDHHGRQVSVAGLEGRLDGVVQVGNHVTLAMTVGGARVWTDAMPATTEIEIQSRPERSRP